MKRSSAEAVIQVLFDVLTHDRFADKAIYHAVEKFRIGGDQKGWVADTAYDIIRYQRLLFYISEGASKKMWRLLGAWCIVNKQPLPAWTEFMGLEEQQVLARHKEAQSTRALRESIPDWLDQRGMRAFGDAWEKELHALNHRASAFARTNTLKISRDELINRLRHDQVKALPVADLPEAIRIVDKSVVFTTPAFHEGLYEVQDIGSQAIAPFLRVEPGMRVIDACCGTGGKTMHLAALMNNKGRLIALDIAAWKLEEVKKRARRAGVHTLECRVIESTKTIKRLYDTADRVLLDVPCSGTGVLKRNPDAKWKLNEDYIKRLLQEQASILATYAPLVRKGGELVYATCSLLPEENEQQVQAFLSSCADQYALEEEKHILPSQGGDGFYMARIRRLL